MNESISDFKAKLYKFQLKVEKDPGLYIFIIVVYSFITVVATLYEFFVALTIIPKIITALFLLTLRNPVHVDHAIRLMPTTLSG